MGVDDVLVVTCGPGPASVNGIDPAAWNRVVIVAMPGHLAGATSQAALYRAAGVQAEIAGVTTPIPDLLELFSRLAPTTVVDLTNGPAALTHAAQHAATAVGLECRLVGETGASMRLPPVPARRAPLCWGRVIDALETLGRSARVPELAVLTGLGESTVRYHVHGRRGYVGMVRCGLLEADAGRLAVTPLGHAWGRLQVAGARGGP